MIHYIVMRHCWPLGASASILVLAGFTASAQENSVPETVIVTAPMNGSVSIDKTGTPAIDVPRSIQVVPRDLIEQQGATKLGDTLRDVSGVTQGGQFAFGFFDRFVVRGLNTSFLEDGLPDGTSDLTGYLHTLTGVDHVEVLKGPGSALYGSTEPGGTINLVHYRPTAAPSANMSEQFGSYNTTTTDISVNGATGIADLNGRIDAEYQQGNGFRNMANKTAELLGSLGYQIGDHDLLLRIEYHHFEDRPDAVGTPFATPSNMGLPLTVPRDTIYYTPFAGANQDFEKVFVQDAWTVGPDLVVNIRGSYTAHTDEIARNAGGTLTLTGSTYGLTKRQLRKQTDNSSDANVQVEPVWHFQTAGMNHTLVTGFDFRNINAGTVRQTADLPNITNVFAPLILETSMEALTFQCDASHSCDNAELLFQAKSLYAVDQIDVTDSLKLRFSGRGDWFDTMADGRSVVPANAGSQHPCTPPAATQCPLAPGVPFSRTDKVFSWDIGAVYFLTPDFSTFTGYSSVIYPIFNTEEPESIGQLPESGTQVEVGFRFRHGDWLALSSALYQATRQNVFSTLTEPNPTGAGNLTVIDPFSYRSEGWETDVNLHPIEGWNITANFTAQNPVLTSNPSAPANVGHAVPSTPTTILNLWTSYDVPLPDPLKTLQVALGMRDRSHDYADAGQTRMVPGTPLFDLATSLPYANWVLRAGIANLFDRVNFQYGAGTGSGVMPGQGRTVFIKLGASF
jgi:iron complex outermembrane recepter protein